MTAAMDELHERWAAEHAAEVAAGQHDDECEHDDRGFHLCHCAKRRRVASGFTEPPGEVIHQAPLCPRCMNEVNHDGDGWFCDACSVSWSATDYGDKGTFIDDHGDDLAEHKAKWLAGREAYEAQQTEVPS